MCSYNKYMIVEAVTEHAIQAFTRMNMPNGISD